MKVLALVLILGTILIAGLPLIGTADQVQNPGGCCGGKGCKCAEPCTCKHAAQKPGCSTNTTGVASETGRVAAITNRIKRYVVRGYHRLTERTILDQEIRQQIYDLIIEKPGIDLKRLKLYTTLNENTLRYHIWKMKCTGKIKVTFEGKTQYFFENHGKYNEKEQKTLALTFISEVSEVIHLIRSNPGITRGDIASVMNVSGPTVTRKVHRLIDKGLISQRKDGKYCRYYAIEREEQTINNNQVKNPFFSEILSP